ncbi:molecular chaperone [Moorella thermoacetica Y72]|nr:molecular chaperone [Moorella thermoacetica Y72]
MKMMTGEYNPLEALKNIPYLDEDFFKEVTGMSWPGPAGLLNRLTRGKWPPVDIVETAGEIIVTVALPGLRQAGDVRVELNGNILRLEGEIYPEIQLLPVVKVHQQEKKQGRFSRSVTLPVAVNSKSARATYQRGLLEIRFIKHPGSQGETLNIEFFKPCLSPVGLEVTQAVADDYTIFHSRHGEGAQAFTGRLPGKEQSRPGSYPGPGRDMLQGPFHKPLPHK